jgi:YbbR domain-containing protein
MASFLRWLGQNAGLLLLAFVLSLIVWVSAVLAADPNEVCPNVQQVPLELRGLDDAHLLFGEIPESVTLTLRAPQSVCQRLANDENSLQAWLTLSALGVGEHRLSVQYRVAAEYIPVRVMAVSPATVDLQIEEFATRALSLQPEITGEPAPGYTLGLAILSESRIVISGTRTLVDQVETATISLDVTDATGELNVTRAVRLLDAGGNPITGLEISPATVNIRQVITRPGTFREVIVRVIYTGAPADGYRLTSLTPTPQIVTVFSNDAQLIRAMPGFVETEPIDLTGATDDIEQRLRLVLPEGVFVDGEQSILVLVGIAAIESSVTLSLPVETIGLSAAYTATLSPASVDVILSGPLPVLQGLQPLDIRVVLDLTGLEPGEHTLTPRVEVLPIGVTADFILPASVEVSISAAPPPTPTPAAYLPASQDKRLL